MDNQEIVGTSIEPKVEKVKQPSVIYLCSKRVMDLIGAIVGLVVFSPIFALISIFYMWGDNKGPVFSNKCEWGKMVKSFIFINSVQ